MLKMYSPEFKDRAVGMVTDHQCVEKSGNWTALVAVGEVLGGVSPHTLRNWVEQSRVAVGQARQSPGDSGREDR